MTEANQKALYERLLVNGNTEAAEAIDKVYNFSGKQEKDVLTKISDNKKSKE